MKFLVVSLPGHRAGWRRWRMDLKEQTETDLHREFLSTQPSAILFSNSLSLCKVIDNVGGLEKLVN